MSEYAQSAPPPVRCADCANGDNGRAVCPMRGRWAGCEWGVPLPPRPEQRPATKPEPSRPPTPYRPPPPQKETPERVRPRHSAAGPQSGPPYYNRNCGICGKLPAQMRAGVHCPMARAVVCMDHCYHDCDFMDAANGHCRFTSTQKRE